MSPQRQRWLRYGGNAAVVLAVAGVSWWAGDRHGRAHGGAGAAGLTMLPAALAGNTTKAAPVDPLAIPPWLSQLPDGPSKEQAVANILLSASRKDFDGAWKEATALPAGTGRELAMSKLAAALARSDPAKAAKLWAQADPKATNVDTAEAIAKAWMVTDPEAASEWMNTLPHGDARDAAVTQLVYEEQGTNPEGAMAWANTITSQKARVSAILHIMRTWAKTDPNAAMAAAQAANVPDDRRAAIMQAITAPPPTPAVTPPNRRARLGAGARAAARSGTGARTATTGTGANGMSAGTGGAGSQGTAGNDATAAGAAGDEGTATTGIEANGQEGTGATTGAVAPTTEATGAETGAGTGTAEN